MFSTGAPGGVAVGKPNAAELFLKPGDVVTVVVQRNGQPLKVNVTLEVRK